jgi:predicted amidohydrolase YtcJ
MRVMVTALGGLAALGLVLGAAPLPQAQPSAAPPDLVLVNGAVLTVDPRDSVAEAVAVAGGRIVAVGTTAQVKALAGPATEVIDLNGRAVTPGLIDSHVHFSEADKLFTVDLSDPSVKTMNDVLGRVAAHVKTLKPGEWVRGRGWDEGKLAERRYITAADLDTVAPNNPVWLTQTTGHYGVANTYALKMAEVRKDTKDPPAGTIDRDAEGNPSGVMKESAQGLITRHVPPLTRDQQKRGILQIIEDFNSEGMTGAKDPGMGEQKWELYQELLKEDRLTVRVFALWSGPRQASDTAAVMARVQKQPKPPASFGNGLLTSGGVKLFMDGSGGARTAWMYEDWNKNFNEKDAGNKGYPSTPPEDYRQIVSALHTAGIHISTHAIGDRAIDWVVDTYDQILKAAPTKNLRHGIIHGNTPTDHAIDVMARLQKAYQSGYPEAQAPFLWWIGDNYAANLGPERGKRLKPFRTYLRKGVQWGGGSDFAVTPFPARYGLWSSVVRETLNGTHGRTPFGLDESIDIKTALRSYTLWAAHTMFLEDRIGSIEVGKEADLAVWDRNPYTMPPAALKDLSCEMTFVRGKAVYKKDRDGGRRPGNQPFALGEEAHAHEER